MFPPKADAWKRIGQKTSACHPSGPRISVPSAWHQDDGTMAAQEELVQRRFKRNGLGPTDRGQSLSLDNLTSLSLDSGRNGRDKADHHQFLRTLKSVQLFQTTLGIRDNRERLADYLKQCEAFMPRHGNQLLTEIDVDLRATWIQSPTDKDPGTGKIVKQQAAIWELFSTELNILRHLKTIIEIYVTVIHYLQVNASLLQEVSTDKLFPHIDQVFAAHWTLWVRHLRPALLAARSAGVPVRPRDFGQGFADFSDIFEPSLAFCLGITECKDYLRLLEKSETFGDFVKWAQKLSSKNYNTEDGSMDLQLKSLLTTPLQRLTKYGLLLQEILKHSEDPEDREALEEMIRNVTDFCNRMNSRYQEKAEEQEVRGVSERLEDAKLSDMMDSFGEECASYLGQFRLSLLRAMPHNGEARRKLGEADFKAKDERGKWSDVKLLLFTDLLLLAKLGGKRQNLRLLRAPVRLDKMTLFRLSDRNSFVLAVLTDFGSVEGLHCLSAADAKQCDDWLERLGQSQAALRAQLLSSSIAAAAGCVNCGFGAESPPPQLPPPPPPPLRARSRTTLLEVATHHHHQQMHAAHSSSEIDKLDNDCSSDHRQRVAALTVEQQQQLHVNRANTRQQQQQQRWQQHERENSDPTVGWKCPLQQQHQHQQPRSSSAEDATIPEQELTPERRRLIGFISGCDQASQV